MFSSRFTIGCSKLAGTVYTQRQPSLSRWIGFFTYQQRFTASDSSKFVVSILGPPNAGKSTLFNRLSCKTRNKNYRLGSASKRPRGRISSRSSSQGNAIVSPLANTTRDRRECWGRIGSSEFTLVDTAGVDGARIQLLGNSKKTEKHILEKSMMAQTLEAAKDADLVLVMWDAKVGITQDLVETARWLRKLGKEQQNVKILANKLEGDAWAYEGSDVMDNLEELQRLGFGKAIPISALQGDGLADVAVLIERAKKQKFGLDSRSEEEIKEKKTRSETVKPLQLAILGRQNVGKSTLVNTLVKNDRVLAGSIPGLTRDAIAVDFIWENQPTRIVDTAGIRKLTKRLDDSIEDMSVADAIRAMKVAEVGVLVLDAEEQFLHRQELAICNAIISEGRALVIAANKMDLLEMSSDYTPDDFAKGVRNQLESRIPMLRSTPIIPMSCKSSEGVDNILPAVMNAKTRWSKMISTGLLNRWLKQVSDGTSAPVVNGVRAKLKYIIQTKGRPPSFILFCNVSELPDSYLRYLKKHFQDSFELYGMAVRIIVKRSAKANPYRKEQKARSGFGLGGREGRRRRNIKKKSLKRRMAN